MKNVALLFCVCVPLAAGVACGSGEEASGGATSELSIEKLGLVAIAPSGSKVKDALMGDGVMIQGPGIVVTIEKAGDKPKTVEAAKDDAAMYSPTNIKTEKLADGWAMSFTNTGGMGTNYWVNVRREIGGQAYWCSTTASSEAQQQNALAACKSLSK